MARKRKTKVTAYEIGLKSRITSLETDLERIHESRTLHKEARLQLEGQVKSLQQQVVELTPPLFENAYTGGTRMPLKYFSTVALLSLLHTMEREALMEEQVLGDDGAKVTMRRGFPRSYTTVLQEVQSRGIAFRPGADQKLALAT